MSYHDNLSTAIADKDNVTILFLQEWNPQKDIPISYQKEYGTDFLMIFPNLNSLHIYNSKDVLPYLVCLGRLPKVKLLTLGNLIEPFDNQLDAHIFQHIEKLNLNDLDLAALPNYILQIPHLKELNLTNCRLTSIPENVVWLSSIEEITLRTNPQLRMLPNSWKKCTQLKYLIIEDSPITNIDILSEINSLQIVQLHIFLPNLPTSFIHSNLQALYLDENSCEDIDVRILDKMPKLRYLMISNPKQTTLFALCTQTKIKTLYSNYNLNYLFRGLKNYQAQNTLYLEDVAFFEPFYTNPTATSLDKLSNLGLYKLFTFNVLAPLQNEIQLRITQLYTQLDITKKITAPNAFVSILATAPFDIKTIQEKCTKYKIAFNFAICDKTTHIVVKTGTKLSLEQWNKYILLTISNLNDTFNELADQENNTAKEIEHIKAMLNPLGFYPSKLDLALTLIPLVGFRKEFATPLFIMLKYKIIPNQQHRYLKKILKMLIPEWKPYIAIPRSSLFYSRSRPSLSELYLDMTTSSYFDISVWCSFFKEYYAYTKQEIIDFLKNMLQKETIERNYYLKWAAFCGNDS